jgi:transcriptional regulator with XRE-family HTH domain
VRHPSEMSPADLLGAREALRLTITELAIILGLDARDAPPDPDREPALARSARQREPLSERTVRRWEKGPRPISRSNAEAFARFLDYTDRAVAAVVDAHRDGRPIVVYPDDAAFHQAEPHWWASLPASWHRAVAHQAAQQIPAYTDFPPRGD